MPYYVCHKCGLTRRKEPEDLPDLGYCQCSGKTQFLYDETPRTRDEAIVISVQNFLRNVELYVQQKRESDEYYELIQEYSKALSYKAVYKVVVNK